MTKKSAAMIFVFAGLTGPAIAMGVGGCNSDASYSSADSDASEQTRIPVETPDARS